MGRIWIPGGGGGGADLDLITAGADDVLDGKVIVDRDGNALTGKIKSMSGGTITPSTAQQTIACAGKRVTSDFIIPAFSLPPASALKKGYVYKIYGKQVTGNFEGYVAGTLDVYNRGAWGSGYSISNIKQSPETGYVNGSITAQTSAIKVTSPTQRTDHSWSYHCYAYLNKVINLAAYKKINVIVSHTSANRNWTDYMYAYVGSSPGKDDLASTNFKASTNEITISIDVSNLNVNGYLWFYFYRTSGSSDSEAYEERFQTCYIHRIWFEN